MFQHARPLFARSYSTKLDFERKVAFSQESPKSKTYVQDLLIRDAAKIYDMWIR